MTKEINPITQWWVSPHLPKEHIFITPENKPEDQFQLARLYFRKWLVHPAKRHLTHEYSSLLTKAGCEIIGVTGSAGKTTTKEMIASVLSQKYKTKWSPGNIDPVYNIPTTTLSTPLNTKKLVLEMGIEFPGEMDFYLWLSRPKTGVMTNVYWAHTEFFGDVDGVLEEKAKLIESLPPDGFAILNSEDTRVRKLASNTKAKVIWYGNHKDSDIRASNVNITPDLGTMFILKLKDKSVNIELPLLGRHFVQLALAAAAVGRINGLSLKQIKAGLESVEQQAHRMIPKFMENGAVIIDDTYNANPLAVIGATRVLKEIAGKQRILVLGEMKELGVYEDEGHREVGKFVAQQGVDYLFTLGEATNNTTKSAVEAGMNPNRAIIYKNKKDLVERLQKLVKPGAVIMVKGSRSMKMEEVVERIVL